VTHLESDLGTQGVVVGMNAAIEQMGFPSAMLIEQHRSSAKAVFEPEQCVEYVASQTHHKASSVLQNCRCGASELNDMFYPQSQQS